MMDLNKRRNVDLLVEEFWKHGYLTVSRKFGTYLPEPAKVGSFEVDIVARQRNNYAIGISLTPSDLNNPSLIDKINYLATRQTKYSNKKVILFIGIPLGFLKNIKRLIDSLHPEIKSNIKLFEIMERSNFQIRRKDKKEKILFS